MDFNMPVMGGIESTHQIQKLIQQKKEAENGKVSKNKLVIMGFSAYTDEGTLNEAYQAGMSQVVPKPSTKNLLLQTMKELNIF